MKDYYKILEITSSATSSDVKKSFRRLAMKFHPDRNLGDIVYEEKFKEIQEAYEILSDPEKRNNYDCKYESGEESHSSSSTHTKKQSDPPKKEEPITLEILLSISNKIREQVDEIDKEKISEISLFRSLNDLLCIDNLGYLYLWENQAANKQIINDVCFCCKFLSQDHLEIIKPRLVQLAGADNEIIQMIHKMSNRNKVEEFLRRNLEEIWERFSWLIIIGGIGLIIILANINFSSSSDSKSNRPESGNLYTDQPISISNETEQTNPSTSELVDAYAGWDKVSMETGSSPSCYNFTPRYDYSIDNKLEVSVGPNTDAVIKLMNCKNNRCIRYVYVRSGTKFDLANIPQGRYYTKIAYGTDWREKIVNGQCKGKFVHNALYKKGDKILDFYKVYTGTTEEDGHLYKNYEIPSYSLSLQVILADFDPNIYSTEKISEDAFNE